MRKHIRRLSLGNLSSSSSNNNTIRPWDAQHIPTTLVQFLVSIKDQYLADVRASPSRGNEWTVVMGNEAGDLDSIASSIAFAWLQSHHHSNPTTTTTTNKRMTIPLIQMQSHDLPLRPENLHALSLAGISSPASQLLTLSDVSFITSLSRFPSHKFALVDHNRLGLAYAHTPGAEVTALVDHHLDEGLYRAAEPRVVGPCGSCASHLAGLFISSSVSSSSSASASASASASSSADPESESGITGPLQVELPIPPELATLLLAAIVIDTDGFHPDGKATFLDAQAATFLAPRSTYALSFPTSPKDFLFPSSPSTSPTTTTATSSQAFTQQQQQQQPPILSIEKLYKHDLIKSLYTTLSSKKDAVSHLTALDLLRRDYKEYTYTYTTDSGSGSRHGGGEDDGKIKVGMSSVPLSLEMMDRDETLGDAIVSWMETRSIQILGVLTSFSGSGSVGSVGSVGGKNNKHKREQAWIVYYSSSSYPPHLRPSSPLHSPHGNGNGKGTNEDEAASTAHKLWKGLEENEELDLKRYKHKHHYYNKKDKDKDGYEESSFSFERKERMPKRGCHVRVYQVGNVKVGSRKVVEPVVRSVLEVGERERVEKERVEREEREEREREEKKRKRRSFLARV